jgi:hypothetical protein
MPAATKPRIRWKTILGAAASIALVVGIFAWAITKFADNDAVLDALGTLTPLEFWTMFAAMVFNLPTYRWANQAALPGLGVGKAAVLTQTMGVSEHEVSTPEAFAVFSFSRLLWALPITLGGFTYLIWRAKKDWRSEADADRQRARVSYGPDRP